MSGDGAVAGPLSVAPKNILVYMHVLLGVAAAAQRWWMGECGVPTDDAGILAAGFATMAGYDYLRLVRAFEDDPIPSPHILWMRRFRLPMLGLVSLLTIAAVVLWWGASLYFGTWSALALLILGGYLVPFTSNHERSKGLREIPFMKSFLVAAAWTFITMGVVPGGEESTPAYALAVVQFCFFLGLAIITDIGDLPYDRPSLRTMPQVLGLRGAKVMAALLFLPSFSFHAAAYALSRAQDGGSGSASLGALTGLAVALGLVAMARPGRPKWFYTILVDGIVLLVPGLAWVGQWL